MKAADWYFTACPLPFPTTEWRCRVVDAADGDTFTVSRDSGWFTITLHEVRLLGIDAYERRKGTDADRAKGRAAWEFVTARYVGRWAVLHTHMDPDKYGRILARLVVLGEDGRLHDVADELRAAGYEKPAV